MSTREAFDDVHGEHRLTAVSKADEFFAEVWAQEELVNHAWWEQAAVMTLLGYTLTFPIRRAAPSAWLSGTAFLPTEWGSLTMYEGYRPARIRHYAGMLNRLRRVNMWIDRIGLRADNHEPSWLRVAYEPLHAVRIVAPRLRRTYHRSRVRGTVVTKHLAPLRRAFDRSC